MRRWFSRTTLGVALAVPLAALLFHSVLADSLAIDFESYVLGNVNGQGGGAGWSSTGAYDQAVVANTYGYSSFGSQSFRISNAVTSGSFGDQTFTKSLTDEAGESTAQASAFSGGVRQSHFEAQFDIASTLSTQQADMHVSVSPDRGDGARMGYVRFDDGPTGIDVFFDDYQDLAPYGTLAVPAAGCGAEDNFFETQIAVGLSRLVPHTIKITMDLLDGARNDVVKVYIDGNLVHIGTSWEDYFRWCTESGGGVVEVSPVADVSRTVDSLLIRESGTANSANAGNGYLFDNVSLSSGPITSPALSTTVVTPANLSTTGFNNSKWFFYNDETDALDNSLGSFVAGPGVPPLQTGSAQMKVSGTQRRNLFSTEFYGVPLGSITQLKFSNYNPSIGNGGAADRSAYLHFNVDFDGVNDATYQCRLVFVPRQNGTVVQNTWQEWDAVNGGNALWSFSGTATSCGANWPATSTGPDAGATTPSTTLRTWNAILADYPGIRLHPVFGIIGLRVGEPYADGYTDNVDKFVLGTSSLVRIFDFEPIFLKVHILKYLDGVKATSVPGNYGFPMTSSWNAANLGPPSSGSYVLGNSEGGAPDTYGADTSPMSAPADYTTSETTSDINASSLVLPIGAQCVPGKFQLVGYSTSNVDFATAAGQTKTNAAPNFTGLTADQYVIVHNKTCPPANYAMSLTKTDNLNPGKYDHVGQVVTYTLTATNTGNVPLHNVTVTDAPALTAFSCTPSSPVATLAPGGTVVCTGTHTITHADVVAGKFVDTGTATSTETAPVTAKDTVYVAPACKNVPVVSLYTQLVGPPKTAVLSATATGGITTITVIAQQNIQPVTYSMFTSGTPQGFPAGTTGPVYIFAKKVNQSAGSVIGVEVTDRCGNITDFDPVDTTVNPGKAEAVTLTGVAGDETLVKIVNDDLDAMRITVNGVEMVVRDLRRHETRMVDISRAMQPRDDNTIILRARGPKGSSAFVTVYPPPATAAELAAGVQHHGHRSHKKKITITPE